jgi:2OG-Fe(II) oxygenase superfamily
MEAGPTFFLSRSLLKARALAARDAYRSAPPFPHAVFDGFLGAALSDALAGAFPRPDHPHFIRRDYREQSGRLGRLERVAFEGVDPLVRHVLAELCGMAFLDFLGTLTGIEGLIADPHFVGAGPSITLPGGHLALHADFNRDRRRHLERKLTAIYYLPREWDPTWGGALELWNEARTECIASHAPLRDRLIVMAHGDRAWHGHPQPLACPDGHFRASIASYYYVAAASDADEEAHGAIW